MATKKPSFQLFLYHASNLIASPDEPKEVLGRIITSLHEHIGVARASIQLRIPSRSSPNPLLIASPPAKNPSFVFWRPISVRGREYGHLTVEARTPVGSPQDWMLTLDTLSEQLALYAERLQLAEDERRLRSEVAELQLRLRTRKVLSRAGGIVAMTLDTTVESAEEWLQAEATRRGRTAYELAEQLILQQVLSRQIAADGRQGAVAA